MSEGVKTPEDVVQNVQSYIIEKEQQDGQLRDSVNIQYVTPESNPQLFETVKGVLNDVNGAMKSDINMPHILIVEDSPHSPAAYSHRNDCIIIDKDALDPNSHSFEPEQQIKAIIAHELGHKLGHERGVANHSPEEKNQMARDVWDTVKDNCSAEHADKILNRFREAGFDPGAIGTTRDVAEMNLTEQGTSANCASEVADSMQRFSDGSKAAELYGDYVAIKSGHGDGVIADIESNLIPGYSDGLDRLNNHLETEDRLDHARELNDAQKAQAAPVIEGDFSPANGGESAGGFDIIDSVLDFMGIEDKPDTQVPLAPDAPETPDTTLPLSSPKA
ncbi:MAG: hypothetical protein ACRBDL_08595 [Alphaproteobacteria bacterium]